LVQFGLACETFAVVSPPTGGAFVVGFGRRTAGALGALEGFGVAEAVALEAVLVAAVPGVEWLDGRGF